MYDSITERYFIQQVIQLKPKISTLFYCLIKTRKLIILENNQRTLDTPHASRFSSGRFACYSSAALELHFSSDLLHVRTRKAHQSGKS